MPLSRNPRSLALLAALAPLATATAQAPADVEPLRQCEVVARANGVVILACDLDWQVRMMFEQRFGREAGAAMAVSPLFAPAREGLMKDLVVGQMEMALLFADFRSNAPQVDLAGVKKTLEVPFEKDEVPRLIKMLDVEDRAALEEELRRLGTSLGERREEFYRTMIARAWLQQSSPVDREVTHEQMLSYYREHLDEYDQPDRARWEELFVSFERHASRAEAYARLARLGNDAHAAAQDAPSDEPVFDEIAKIHSDGFNADEGGLYDWTTKGSLVAATVDDALYTLPVGRMSEILEGPSGFHIVRVLERREAGPTSFEEVQSAIRVGLLNERTNAAINSKLTELKETARLWTTWTGDIGYKRLAELRRPPAPQ